MRKMQRFRFGHMTRQSSRCLGSCGHHCSSYSQRFAALISIHGRASTAHLQLVAPQRLACGTAAQSNIATRNHRLSTITTLSRDHGGGWGEAEFGTLQKKAASRLHRFYVSHPLGPVGSTPTLESLLLETGAQRPTAPAPAAATPAASSSHSPPPAPGPAGPSGKSRRAAAAAAAAATSSSSSPSSPSSLSPAVVPTTVVLEGDEARHAARALRLQPGDRVELCDGRGNLVEGSVSGSDKQRVWVTTDGPAVHAAWRGSRWVVAVACTTLKGGRAEWLVEKLTELGAYMMVPLVTERSQAGSKAKFRTRGSGSASAAASSPYDSSSSGGSDGDGDYQPGRLERVAIAATKQSLRPHALGLAPPTPLADVLPLVRRLAAGRNEREDATSGGPGVHEGGGDDTGPAEAAFDARLGTATPAAAGQGEGKTALGQQRAGGGDGSVGVGGSFSLVAVAGAPPLATVLRELRGSEAFVGSGHASSAGDVEVSEGSGVWSVQQPLRVLFIGPEGDFTPAELAAIVEAGAKPVGLGVNRLRTETAAMGLLSACLFAEE